MNVRLLKAERGRERDGYTPYEVQMLVGSIRQGVVLSSSYRATSELLKDTAENPSGYREYIEKVTHDEVGRALMGKLLEDLKG